MNPDEYAQFTERLTHTLEQDPRVLGLVACGSMAQTHHQPDERSDHDLWVVTAPGTAETFRTDPSWLPDAEEIVLAYRETAHGIKVVYRQGHLVEAAIFEPDDLGVLMVNVYRMLIDRDDLTTRLAEIQAQTTRQIRDTRKADRELLGELLTNLLVGVGRYARGEKLSGHRFIKHHAVVHLLTLLARCGESSEAGLLDNLDPFRRFEFVYPERGAELNPILLLEPPEAARRLLDMADRLLRGCLDDYPVEAVETVRRYLEAIP